MFMVKKGYSAVDPRIAKAIGSANVRAIYPIHQVVFFLNYRKAVEYSHTTVPGFTPPVIAPTFITLRQCHALTHGTFVLGNVIQNKSGQNALRLADRHGYLLPLEDWLELVRRDEQYILDTDDPQNSSWARFNFDAALLDKNSLFKVFQLRFYFDWYAFEKVKELC